MKQKFIDAENKYKDLVDLDHWRLNYHLMPRVGWLNDPNGLCQFQGIYHIFYQYSPEDATGKNKGWGHYSTKDFVHFIREENALFPDSKIDKDGAYSGSAFVKDHRIHFFYTGNIKFDGKFDYINEGRGHYLNYFYSDDGIRFSQKECLLKNEDYPKNMSCHVRDPKIYEDNQQYYMVLGARTKDSVGCVLIYVSYDLKHWSYHDMITSKDRFGYMWECPDFFEIDHQKILITCPQGVEQDGYKYENLYQNGYFLVDGCINDHISLSEFNELDHGFDFYAPQTFIDDHKRRILIGWMGLPDVPYTNPTVKNHWQHALTLPRELKLIGNRLYQYPIEETKQLRSQSKIIKMKKNQTYRYDTQTCEIHIEQLDSQFTIHLRKDVKISYKDHLLTLTLQESGYGRDIRHVEINHIQEIDIFSDTSSLEIFINKGENVLTTRVYDDKDDTQIKVSCDCYLKLYHLKAYQIIERSK